MRVTKLTIILFLVVLSGCYSRVQIKTSHPNTPLKRDEMECWSEKYDPVTETWRLYYTPWYRDYEPRIFFRTPPDRGVKEPSPLPFPFTYSDKDTLRWPTLK